MIWATVSSQPCFCWRYRASPPLAAKKIINLISVLTTWWCPCVESSLVVLERVFAMISEFSWQNSVSLCPASFCIPRPNFPVTPGISRLPTFAFHSPIMKRTSFSGVSSWRSHRSLLIRQEIFHFSGETFLSLWVLFHRIIWKRRHQRGFERCKTLNQN